MNKASVRLTGALTIIGLLGAGCGMATSHYGAMPGSPSAMATLKDVIDAQAAGGQGKVYTALRSAMGHMQMIADPLADAIAKQFPAKFAAR